LPGIPPGEGRNAKVKGGEGLRGCRGANVRVGGMGV
jgi:hypothetical protein